MKKDILKEKLYEFSTGITKVVLEYELRNDFSKQKEMMEKEYKKFENWHNKNFIARKVLNLIFSHYERTRTTDKRNGL